MKSAPAIAFDLRPSRRVGAAMLAIIVLAAIAPWLTKLPLPASLASSVLVLACGTAGWRRYWHPRFRRVAWRESGWTLVDRTHGEQAAVLETHARLGPLLTLVFRHGPRARFHVVLTADNLDAEARRRLVLLLLRGKDMGDDSALVR